MAHHKRDRSKRLQAAQQGTASLQGAKVAENLQLSRYTNPNTGHGSAAEDANALHDLLRGRPVELTGRSNVKDGPDRIVHGKVMIQTKYYQTARESVNAAFDGKTGLYRYKNQVLEVPKDQYFEALELMRQKIKEGRVPGVVNPEEAEKLVKAGSVTYRQARNIAKAGNIDSLWFDVKTQSVTAAYAFGITFAVQYATSRWNGLDHKDALTLSLTAAAGTGTIALGAGVLTQQLLRTAMGQSFTSSVARQVVDGLYATEVGKETVHRLASVMFGKNVTGEAAKNAVTKLLGTNLVISAVSIAAVSLPDLYRALVSKTISWQQFGKNFGVNAAGVGGGTVGALIGGVVGTLVVPGAGTAAGVKIGAAAGGIGGGVLTAWGAKKLLDPVVKDDAEKMVALAQEAVSELAFDYMVTEEEFTAKIAPRLAETITSKWLKAMYQAGSRSKEQDQTRYEFAYRELEPLFAEVISQRSPVHLPAERLVRREMRKISWRLLIEYLRAKLAFWFRRKWELVQE